MFKKIQQKTNLNPVAASLVKRKGRGKTPTSVLVFDLDEKSVEYILGENKKRLVGSLYEKMKGGSKLIFISKVDSVLKRLQEAMPFKIETQLIKDRGVHKLKEEVTKIVLHSMSDKIKPQASTYIGTLFEKETTNSHTFKFGTVQTPSAYFATLLLSKSTQNFEDSIISEISPMKEDEDFLQSGQKESKMLEESLLEIAPCHHSFEEEIEHSFSSHQKLPQLLNQTFEHNNDNNDEHNGLLQIRSFVERLDESAKQKNSQQDQLRKELPLLYTRIKDLNNRISGKLCHKLDQLKTKQTYAEIEREITKSPISKSPLLKAIEPGSHLGKRMKSFEDDMFNDYFQNVETELRDVDDNIFNISNGMRASTDLGLKIKNINFEVTNECDTRPIMKKLKRPIDNKTGKENNEPSGSNQIILEYKTSIPGEKQTTLHVYGRDIQKLEPNCLLNDTIIQFYLKLVQSEFVDNAEKRKFYIFNTYLIEKLKANKAEKSAEEECDFEKTYNNVKKWTKDIDIFEKDFLLFPMHDKAQKHWSLFIVCYPKYLLAKAEPDAGKGTSGKAFILYFDSHGVMEIEIAKLIALYLQYEVMHKKPEIYNMIKNHFNSIGENEFYQVIVPLQDNSTDCGLYLLEYAERFMINHDQILENMQANRYKLHLFPKCIFKSKRADIANIILELAKGNKEVLQEYLKTKKQKLEQAKDNPNEFLPFSMEDIADYLFNSLRMDINELKAVEQDRCIAHCLPVLYEHLSSSSRS